MARVGEYVGENVREERGWGVLTVRYVFRGVLAALLLVQLAAMSWLVLNPSPDVPTSAVERASAWLLAHDVPARLADPSAVEYLLNVALFVPLGFLCALLFRRVPLAVWMMVGICLSGLLELLQLELLPDRSSSARDFTANTIGMFLGAAPVVGGRWLHRRLGQVRRWHVDRGNPAYQPVPERQPEPLG